MAHSSSTTIATLATPLLNNNKSNAKQKKKGLWFGQKTCVTLRSVHTRDLHWRQTPSSQVTLSFFFGRARQPAALCRHLYKPCAPPCKLLPSPINGSCDHKRKKKNKCRTYWQKLLILDNWWMDFANWI